MINFRICGVVAGIGFILSFLIGLMSGALITMVLMRAIIFAAVFFALAAGINFLIENYVPEVFDPAGSSDLDDEAGLVRGKNLDVTIDEEPPEVPKMYREAEASDEVGNINELAVNRISGGGGIDQNQKTVYTLEEDSKDFASPAFQGSSQAASWTPSSSAGGDEQAVDDFVPEPVDSLPDLDSMAGSFSSSSDGGSDESSVASSAEPASVSGVRKVPPPKGQQLKGDFNPKELAAAIRTTLNKDNV